MAGRALPRAIVLVALVAVLLIAAWSVTRRAAQSPAAAPEAAAEGATQTPAREVQALEVAVPGTAAGGAASPTAAPRIEVVRDTPREIELALTLPGGEVIHETVTISPGRAYAPTPAESDELRRGREVFGARLTRTKDAAGDRLLLSYLVPPGAVPPSLWERFSGRTPAAAWLLPIGVAQAQGALGTWTGLSTGYSLGGYLGGLQPSAPWSKVTKNAGYVDSGLDFSDQYAQWMARLDAAENCARNPTQTVTQNAYRQDPQYQQRTLDAIHSARSEVQQAGGAWFANQEATVASQFVKMPGLMGNLTGKMSGWNDTALRQIGDGLVSDATKLVNCDLARPPDAVGDGIIKYRMKRSGYLDYDEEERSVKGTFDLSPLPAVAGGVTLEGVGDFKGKMKSTRFKTSGYCEGRSEIEGGGGIGTLWIAASPVEGTCLLSDATGTHDVGPMQSDTGFRCNFRGVDLVNGGTYIVHAEGEEAPWAECELELAPRRR